MNNNEVGRPGDPKFAIDPREPNRALAVWRAGIINDIVHHGIKSSATLFQAENNLLVSRDNNPSEAIHGCLFFPKDCFRYIHEWEEDLEEMLYGSRKHGGLQSLLPVVTERPTDPQWHSVDNTDIQILSERSLASFLIICVWHQGVDLYKRNEKDTTPENFVYVVFPSVILDEFHEATGKGQKIEVPTKVSSVLAPRKLFFQRRDSVEVIVPNYEDPIKKVSEELGHNRLWIHAVRLPTEEDLARLTMSTPQGEELCQYYQSVV